MKYIKKIWSSPGGRVFYRLLEIFLISGAIGLLTSPQVESIMPPIFTGIAAAITKALREYRGRIKE